MYNIPDSETLKYGKYLYNEFSNFFSSIDKNVILELVNSPLKDYDFEWESNEEFVKEPSKAVMLNGGDFKIKHFILNEVGEHKGINIDIAIKFDNSFFYICDLYERDNNLKRTSNDSCFYSLTCKFSVDGVKKTDKFTIDITDDLFADVLGKKITTNSELFIDMCKNIKRYMPSVIKTYERLHHKENKQKEKEEKSKKFYKTVADLSKSANPVTRKVLDTLNKYVDIVEADGKKQIIDMVKLYKNTLATCEKEKYPLTIKNAYGRKITFETPKEYANIKLSRYPDVILVSTTKNGKKVYIEQLKDNAKEMIQVFLQRTMEYGGSIIDATEIEKKSGVNLEVHFETEKYKDVKTSLIYTYNARYVRPHFRVLVYSKGGPKDSWEGK